jgi:glycogen debranching enzyme
MQVGYSPANTPHLAPAVDLEDAIMALSKKLPSLGLPTTLNSPPDLNALIPHIKSAIDGARLYEYYVFDVQASVKSAAAALEAGKETPWKGPSLSGKSLEQLSGVVKAEGIVVNYRAYSERFGTTVKPEVAAGFAKAAWPGEDTTSLASKWGKVLDILNVDLYTECNEDLSSAQDQIIGRLRYTRIDEHGPRLGEINEK